VSVHIRCVHVHRAILALSPDLQNCVIVFRHPGYPAHFSVDVIANGLSVWTHLVGGTGDLHTWIRTVQPTQLPGGKISGQADIPLTPTGATSAQLYEESRIGTDAGPYDIINNSCASYICSVLVVGGVPGVPAPRGPTTQGRYLYRLTLGG